MATGSRVCPHCGRLNGIDEERCNRCGRSLPGTVAGGLAAIGRSGSAVEFPVTTFFLALCFGVFALCVMQSRSLPLLQPFPGLILVRWGALFTGVASLEPWRLLASMFVHMNAIHLGLNMMTFVSFGRMTEPRLGPGRYAVLFVVTGVLGFVTSQLWYAWTGTVTVTAGASGGLFGLGGALVGFLYARGDSVYKDVLLRLVVYGVAFALIAPVNNAAHLGGLVSGVLLGFLFEKQKRRALSDRIYLVLGAALMLLSIASIALSALSPLSRNRGGEESTSAANRADFDAERA